MIARLQRLERRRQPTTHLGHRIVFTISSLPDDNIASFNDNNDRHCIREAGEPLQPFIDRAFVALTGAHCIYPEYSSPEVAPARDCEPVWQSNPSPA